MIERFENLLIEMNINPKELSVEDMLERYIKTVEGYVLNAHSVKRVTDMAIQLVKKHQKTCIEKRLDELRSGQINFDDFNNASELADYIEFGD